MSQHSSQVLVHEHQEVKIQQSQSVPKAVIEEEKPNQQTKQIEDDKHLPLNVIDKDQTTVNNLAQHQQKQVQKKQQQLQRHDVKKQEHLAEKGDVVQLMEIPHNDQAKNKQVQKQVLVEQTTKQKQNLAQKVVDQEKKESQNTSAQEKEIQIQANNQPQAEKQQLKPKQVQKSQLNKEVIEIKEEKEAKDLKQKISLEDKTAQLIQTETVENTHIVNQKKTQEQAKRVQNHTQQQQAQPKQQEVPVFNQCQPTQDHKVQQVHQNLPSNQQHHQNQIDKTLKNKIKQNQVSSLSEDYLNHLFECIAKYGIFILEQSQKSSQIPIQATKHQQKVQTPNDEIFAKQGELVKQQTVQKIQIKAQKHQQHQKKEESLQKAIQNEKQETHLTPVVKQIEAFANEKQIVAQEAPHKQQEKEQDQVKHQKSEEHKSQKTQQLPYSTQVQVKETQKKQIEIQDQKIGQQDLAQQDGDKDGATQQHHQYHEVIQNQKHSQTKQNAQIQYQVQPQIVLNETKEIQHISAKNNAQTALRQQEIYQTAQKELENNNQAVEEEKQPKDDKKDQLHIALPIKQEEIQDIHQKQKLRINTEFIESVNQQNKEKDRRIIEFTQFAPTQQHQINESQKDIQTKKVVAVKTEIAVDHKIDQKQQEALKLTFHPNYQSIEPTPVHKQKPAEIMNKIVEGKESPKKESGKIAKRTLYDKKVHQIVKQLNKYDQKKIQLPVLQSPKKTSKKSIDLSKLNVNIQLESNVMNITIGQLTSKDAQTENAQKLLDEIESLKKKLGDLQKRKEERMSQMEDNENSEKMELTNDNIINFRGTKKQFTGRIYKKMQTRNSRLSEQVKPFGSDKKAETIAIEPATMSSASKHRMTSTLGFQTQNQLNLDSDADMNKTMAINFRVRRPSKSIQGVSQFQSNQKVSNKKNKEKLDQDKCFQTSRRQDVYEKLEFTEEQSLTAIQKPVQRQLKYQPYFRQLIEKYFIDLGKQVPNRQMDQQQFVNLAKVTFKRFGVNLQAERSAALSVKKYKNCISFVLDSARTIIWYYQGKFYFGGWAINNVGEGQKSGWGYEYVPGKYVYSGVFQQNKRHGYGVIKFLTKQNDTLYEGNWINGFKEGKGKQLENDGVEYIGSWAQGKKHGYGTLRISEYEYYSGNLTAGIKNGEGTQVFKNGDRYTGNYKEGKFQGKGTYIWSNYSKYEGDFVQGARNGYGVWIANHLDPKSDTYEGQYKNDKKNGYGVYKWKDGTTYQGEFLNDLKHGEGTVSYGDGRKANLQWFQGSVLSKPPLDKQQKINIRRGSSKASSHKSDSKSRKFEGTKMNSDLKSKAKKVFNGIQS